MPIVIAGSGVRLNTIPGGSQSPLRQVQPGPGCTVGQTIAAGSQLPLTQIQSDAGCTVVQLPSPGFVAAGAGAVYPAGANPGGSQSPFTQTQSEAGWTE